MTMEAGKLHVAKPEAAVPGVAPRVSWKCSAMSTPFVTPCCRSGTKRCAPLDKEGGVVLALGPSDVVTIMPHFHQVRFRDYKTYYPVCSS